MKYETFEKAKEYIERNSFARDLELLAEHQNGYKQSTILGVVYSLRHRRTADVVEVVRCGKCEHSHVNGDKLLCTHIKGKVGAVNEDDYCSSGERAEDE